MVPDRQAIYHGFVKAKEARHDADLYRLYHKGAKEIDRIGGKIRRVVLDYELKQELYRKLSALVFATSQGAPLAADNLQ